MIALIKGLQSIGATDYYEMELIDGNWLEDRALFFICNEYASKKRWFNSKTDEYKTEYTYPFGGRIEEEVSENKKIVCVYWD